MVEIADGFEELKNQGKSILSVKLDKEPDKNIIADTSQLVFLDGLNLTRDEFEKACYVGQAILDDHSELEKEQKIEHLINLFKQEVKNRFSFATKFEWLEVKDTIPEEGVNIKVLAARFAKKRPLLYLLIDKEMGDCVVVDEKQFDAFDRGPFKKSKI